MAPLDPLDPHQSRSVEDLCGDPPPAGLRAGIAQFNHREFYLCHETLEEIWLAEARPVRRLYQGILQVGVAFYHLGRGNYRGAINLLASGLTLLETFPAICQGVDLAGLIAQTRRAQAALCELGPERCAEFDTELIPTIQWAGDRDGDRTRRDAP